MPFMVYADSMSNKDDDDMNGGRRLSHAELALWRVVTKDVDLAEGAEYQKRHSETDGEDFAAMMASENVRPQKTSEKDEVRPSVSRNQGKSARDLDKRTAMRLNRGQLDIEGRIDLHGYGVRQAQDALNRFILNAYAHGKRCVLVITGKGHVVLDEEREAETPGLLRRRLPHWVHEAPLDQIVLSIAQASAQHGGGGAYYVLLRRKR